MASKPETQFRKRVRDKLKTLKNLHFFSIQQASINGTPDILLCANGRFVAWELKKDASSKPTVLQTYHLDTIRKYKGVGEVVHPTNFEEKFEQLRKICEEL